MRFSTAGKVLLALATVTCVNRIQAQGLMVGAGAALPMGDFGDFAKTGWVASAGVHFPVGSKSLAVRVDGNYSQNGSECTSCESEKLATFLGGVEFGLGGKSSHPYLVGELGYMKAICDGCEGAIAWAAGAGFTGGKSLFVEARYVSATKDGFTTSVILATVGLRFGGKK